MRCGHTGERGARASVRMCGYGRLLSGEDSEFFQSLLLDLNEVQVISPNYWATRDQVTDYAIEIKAMRPLPAGLYEINLYGQAPDHIPCEFVQPPSTWRFTFESVEDALHEAFFDPVALGDAVGADGVLKPAAFVFDGGDATIQRIDWLDGQVRMTLSPHTALPDHHIDFIALDGSVSLRLDFDDAAQVADVDGSRTLAWGVCSQPWQPADLLMLRISESPADLAGVTFNADCAPVATASPTPTPEVMPTATPVPTPTARWSSPPRPCPIPSRRMQPSPQRRQRPRRKRHHRQSRERDKRIALQIAIHRQKGMKVNTPLVCETIAFNSWERKSASFVS